ncbi:thioredoxin-disulfide reductase [Clostridium sp. CAG:964]|nr:thioredoxin-disulfide reductase [Clostridium sp. CAG:964]
MYDIVIIGSGPAGMSAAIYAQRAGLKAVVVEKECLGTGKIAESLRVDNYPGLFGENGYDLGEKFRTHAENLGAEFIEGEIIKIVRSKGYYTLQLDNDEALAAKTVIYAAGTQCRRLGVVGEQELLGRGVSYCAVCDGAFYKNKVVAVIGGGDTALGDAVLLSGLAKKVYLVHRRGEFRANKALQNKVSGMKNIVPVLNAAVQKINGKDHVEAVAILQNGSEKALPVDGVFVAIGSTPNSTLVKELLDIDENGYIAADETGVTSADGIFAAGDVRTKKLRQVVTAVSDGANCVLSAEEYLNKNIQC